MSPRQVELVGAVPQGIGPETDRDLERHTDHFSDIASDLLSLFKGQGAAARDDLDRRAGSAAHGGRLAQLVRALP